MPQVFVSIGSNVDRDASIRAGVSELRAEFSSLVLSSVYESEAVGFEGDAFYNLVAAFETDKSIDTVLKVFSAIEANNGRLRGSEKFAPRTLDLDLLLYGDAVLSTQRYHVPRDEILRYAFVLWPLAELEPDLVHPEVHVSYAELWARFDKTGPALKPVAFAW